MMFHAINSSVFVVMAAYYIVKGECQITLSLCSAQHEMVNMCCVKSNPSKLVMSFISLFSIV